MIEYVLAKSVGKIDHYIQFFVDSLCSREKYGAYELYLEERISFLNGYLE